MLREQLMAASLFTIVFFLPSYLLLDISRVTFILLTVTSIAIAYESRVVLFLPQPPVDELLHQRACQVSRKRVDENDGLHAQNLPHVWLRRFILCTTKQNTVTHGVKRKHPTRRPSCWQPPPARETHRRAPQRTCPPAPAPPPPAPLPSRPAEVTHCRRCATPRGGDDSASLSGGVSPAPRPRRGRRRAWPCRYVPAGRVWAGRRAATAAHGVAGLPVGGARRDEGTFATPHPSPAVCTMPGVAQGCSWKHWHISSLVVSAPGSGCRSVFTERLFWPVTQRGCSLSAASGLGSHPRTVIGAQRGPAGSACPGRLTRSFLLPAAVSSALSWDY